MRFPRFPLLVVFVLVAQLPLAQQTATSVLRDPQALAVLQNSFHVMGGIVPNDSVAGGTVTIVAGSLSETGTIQVLTRGTDQSLEEITTPSAIRTVIYSQGQANEQNGNLVKSLYLERAASSQSALFPLVLVASSLNNRDVAVQYIGTETLSGTSAIHIRTWNTYASSPDWQGIAEFTTKDFWFDSKSALPAKLSYVQREAGGSGSSGVLIEVFYSGFQNSGGILYPSSAMKWLNGTPWTTVQISSVSLNTGLTDASFPIVQVTP